MALTQAKTTNRSTLPLTAESMAESHGPAFPAAQDRYFRYLSLYTGLPFDNYACGGAACSNALTPLGPPDVSTDQLAWFIKDHVLSNSSTNSTTSPLNISGSTTLAILWIGTNDLGIHSLLAPDSPTSSPFSPTIPPLSAGSDNATTVPSLASCQLSHIRTLYTQHGIQNFLLMSTIPLHLTRLYSPLSTPTIYYPTPHDGPTWSRSIFHLSTALNTLLQAGAATLASSLASNPNPPSITFFDTYALFERIYLSPSTYLNGTLPANVTGHCHQCPDANDWRRCGEGDCVGEGERDSFMWWDELHPSEQTGRVVAGEVARLLGGQGH
ncbi:MAG: hypothetical protein Q9160_005104 [Pyrenula sp. 1 TL-2023]